MSWILVSGYPASFLQSQYTFENNFQTYYRAERPWQNRHYLTGNGGIVAEVSGFVSAAKASGPEPAVGIIIGIVDYQEMNNTPGCGKKTIIKEIL